MTSLLSLTNMPHRNYFDIFNYGIVPNLNYLSEQRSTRMDKAPSTPPSNDDGDVNGDISGDDQSITSERQGEHNDENSMDSDRGGALNLVSRFYTSQ
jgi:hypothetical protein